MVNPIKNTHLMVVAVVVVVVAVNKHVFKANHIQSWMLMIDL